MATTQKQGKLDTKDTKTKDTKGKDSKAKADTKDTKARDTGKIASPRDRSPSPHGSRRSSTSSRSRSSSLSPKTDKDQRNQTSRQGAKKKENKDPTRQDEIGKELLNWEKKRQQEQEKKKNELEATRKADQTAKDQSEKKQKKDEIQELEELMLEAAQKEDVKKLRKSLTKIEDRDLEDPFNQVYDDAKLLVLADERKEQSKSAQSRISQAMVSEIRSFKRPPEVVYDVVRATLVIMGYDDACMKDWPSSRKEFVVSGREAFHKRINAYDTSKLASDAANKALKFIDLHQREDAYAVCNSVGTFYDWVAGACEEAVACDAKQCKTRKKSYKALMAQQRESEKKKEDEKRKDKAESTRKTKH